jgi:hypothetical protein
LEFLVEELFPSWCWCQLEGSFQKGQLGGWGLPSEPHIISVSAAATLPRESVRL